MNTILKYKVSYFVSLCLCAFVPLLFTLFSTHSIFALEDEGLGMITSMVGDVTIKHADFDLWIKAQEKMTIKSSDTIKTGANSKATVVFDDESLIHIAPLTKITLEKLIAEKESERRESVFDLAAGKVRAKVKRLKTNDSRFEINTPTAVAGVRGTDFMVEVDKDISRVAVFDGKVEVGNAIGNIKEHIMVEKEHITEIHKNKPPEIPKIMKEEDVKQFRDWVEKPREDKGKKDDSASAAATPTEEKMRRIRKDKTEKESASADMSEQERKINPQIKVNGAKAPHYIENKGEISPEKAALLLKANRANILPEEKKKLMDSIDKERITEKEASQFLDIAIKKGKENIDKETMQNIIEGKIPPEAIEKILKKQDPSIPLDINDKKLREKDEYREKLPAGELEKPTDEHRKESVDRENIKKPEKMPGNKDIEREKLMEKEGNKDNIKKMPHIKDPSEMPKPKSERFDELKKSDIATVEDKLREREEQEHLRNEDIPSKEELAHNKPKSKDREFENIDREKLKEFQERNKKVPQLKEKDKILEKSPIDIAKNLKPDTKDKFEIPEMRDIAEQKKKMEQMNKFREDMDKNKEKIKEDEIKLHPSTAPEKNVQNFITEATNKGAPVDNIKASIIEKLKSGEIKPDETKPSMNVVLEGRTPEEIKKYFENNPPNLDNVKNTMPTIPMVDEIDKILKQAKEAGIPLSEIRAIEEQIKSGKIPKDKALEFVKNKIKEVKFQKEKPNKPGDVKPRDEKNPPTGENMPQKSGDNANLNPKDNTTIPKGDILPQKDNYPTRP